MAKEKLNKSALIRDLLKKNKGKGPTEIAAIFKQQHGQEIPVQYVSTVKSNMKSRRGAKKLAKKAKRSGGKDGGHAMYAAAQLLVQAGSIEAARDALEHVAKVAALLR